MGASNRTLLAKLGFADADRKNPRHDRACNYLALRTTALCATIAAALPRDVRVTSAKGSLEHMVTKGEGKYSTTVGFIDVFATFDVERDAPVRDPVENPVAHHRDRWDLFKEAVRSHPEYSKHPLIGGRVQVPNSMFQSYVDWVREFDRELLRQDAADRARESALYRERIARSPTTESVKFSGRYQAIIEVKIGAVSSGDLLRQLSVYRQFTTLQGGSRETVRPPAWCKAIGDEGDWMERMVREGERQLDSDCRRVTVVVVDYDVDAEYRAACRLANVHIVRLGRGFEQFLAESTEPTPEVGEVPEV